MLVLPARPRERARHEYLASGTNNTSATARSSRRVVGQWGGAGGASCEDHFAFSVSYWGPRRLKKLGLKNPFFNSQKIAARSPRVAYRRPAGQARRPQLDHKTRFLILVRQVHLDGHPRPPTIVPQLQSMTVRDRPTALAARPEGHDRRVLVVLQLDD